MAADYRPAAPGAGEEHGARRGGVHERGRVLRVACGAQTLAFYAEIVRAIVGYAIVGPTCRSGTRGHARSAARLLYWVLPDGAIEFDSVRSPAATGRRG